MESGENSVRSYWKSYLRASVDLGLSDPATRRCGGCAVQKSRRQMFVKVIGGIGEGREEEHLAITGIDRSVELAQDVVFQVLQLGVVGWGDLFHFGEERLDRTARSALQVVLPSRQIHVGQTDTDLAADLFVPRTSSGIKEFVVVIRLGVLKGGETSVNVPSCPVLRKFSIAASVAR